MYDPTHYGMGSTTRASTQRPSRPAKNPDPDDQGRGPQPREATRRSTTQGGYQLPCDVLGNQEMVTKVMTDTALHRMADEPSPCLQCRHGQHNSTTSHPDAVWQHDHDDSHARMSTRRRHSLQAKLARTSLRLSTLQSGELPLCTSPSPSPELYLNLAS